MSRIFTSLAVVAVTLLLAAIAFGLGVGFEIGAYNAVFHERVSAERKLDQLSTEGKTDEADSLRTQIDAGDKDFRQTVRRATWHMLVGIIAGIVAILVNSISVTYFIGTSRWCKEVTDTYSLSDDHSAESTRLKRCSFPWALFGILTVLAIVALGGASDPGTGLDSTASFAMPHFFLAVAGVALIAVSFIQQASFIRKNSEIVDTILREVREIRIAKGLDVDQPVQ